MNSLIVYENNVPALAPETALAIAEFEKQVKIIKEKEDELKQAILEAMEAENIVKLDTPELVISYIAPTDRETFDTKTFKAENPDLYDEYAKLTPIKASIRIKVK